MSLNQLSASFTARSGALRHGALTVLAGVLTLSAARAQNAAPAPAAASEAPAAGPRKTIYYFTAQGEQLPSAEGADHRAEITMRDSVSGTLREFYPSGKAKRIIPLAHVQQGIKHGVETTFSETGGMLTRQEFYAGEAQGELVAYYPSGTVKSRTHFVHDQMKSKECYTATGEARNCPPDDHGALYPGGEGALITEFIDRVKVPNDKMEKTFNGKVYPLQMVVIRVKLSVDSLGAVKQAELLNVPSENWKAAVLKAVPSLRHFTPALRDGVAVAQTIEVPLTFSMDKTVRPSSTARGSYIPNMGEARGTREINTHMSATPTVILRR